MDATQTVPASASEAAARVVSPSPLVLVAMGLGIPAGEAIALVSARAAEARRMASMLAL